MIKYKLIEHERVEDAPFVGALISAINCNFNCPNCFNQKVKDLPTIEKSAKEIVEEIKSNPFNQGIIFGGLEWSLQISEAIELAKEAERQILQTFLYSGSDNFNKEYLQYFDYVKIGRYDENLTTDNNIQYGIKLATSNQIIFKRGVDY